MKREEHHARRLRTERRAPPPKTFEQYCAQYTQSKIPHVVKIGKRYFYDPQSLLSYAREHKIDPYSVGMYLGEEKQSFHPTGALVDLIAVNKDVKTAVITSKAAWLFLCGRDVLMAGVLEHNNVKQGEEIIVLDVQDRPIGTAMVFSNFNPKYKNNVFLKHRLDKGEYLRRER